MRVSVYGGILQGPLSIWLLDERLLRHWLGELDSWKKEKKKKIQIASSILQLFLARTGTNDPFAALC